MAEKKTFVFRVPGLTQLAGLYGPQLPLMLKPGNYLQQAFGTAQPAGQALAASVGATGSIAVTQNEVNIGGVRVSRRRPGPSRWTQARPPGPEV
jgi:hypothetical protein